MRYQTKRKVRRVVLIAVLAAIVLGLGGWLIYHFSTPEVPLEERVMTLTADSAQRVTALDDGLLLSSGLTLSRIDLAGKLLWAAEMPAADMNITGNGELVALWNETTALLLSDETGMSLLRQESEAPIQGLTCGKEHYAITTQEDRQRRGRVYKLDGTQIDDLLFPYQDVLGVGFYSDNLSQLWTLSLDSHATLPITHLKTYQPGKSTTGNITVNGEILYLAQPKDKSFMTVGTRNIQFFSATGERQFEKSIYGWYLQDLQVDSQGRAQFLLCPAGAEEGVSTLSALWYIRAEADGSTTETRISLPAGCIRAVLTQNGIAAFSAEGVHTMDSSGGNYAFHKLPHAVSAVTGLVPGQAAVVQSPDGVFLVPLQ